MFFFIRSLVIPARFELPRVRVRFRSVPFRCVPFPFFFLLFPSNFPAADVDPPHERVPLGDQRNY